MTKPKTLGEIVDEDANRATIAHTQTAITAIRAWLQHHNITDCVPLEVEEIGVLEDVADHGEAAMMAFRVGEKYWLHMEDCEGRTVALLTKPQAAKSGGIDGNG